MHFGDFMKQCAIECEWGVHKSWVTEFYTVVADNFRITIAAPPPTMNFWLI